LWMRRHAGRAHPGGPVRRCRGCPAGPDGRRLGGRCRGRSWGACAGSEPWSLYLSRGEVGPGRRIPLPTSWRAPRGAEPSRPGRGASVSLRSSCSRNARTGAAEPVCPLRSIATLTDGGPGLGRSPPLGPPLRCLKRLGEVDRLAFDPIPAEPVDAHPEVPSAVAVADLELHNPDIVPSLISPSSKLVEAG
jgi:hypothetical protein